MMVTRMKKPDGFDSLIYGQDPQCRITMDWTKTQCNSNGIVMGPSGCGKSWNFVVPCLAHMEHTNPVVIVTKKSTMKMTAKLLKKHGYHNNYLNFVDPKKKDYGYDPMHYCKRNIDVTDLAYTVTHSGGGAIPQDPFWDDSAQQIADVVLRFVKNGHYPGGRRMIDGVELLDAVHPYEQYNQVEFDDDDADDVEEEPELEEESLRFERTGPRFPFRRPLPVGADEDAKPCIERIERRFPTESRRPSRIFDEDDLDDEWGKEFRAKHPLHYAMRRLVEINKKDFGIWAAFNDGADRTSASIASTLNSHIAKAFPDEIREILRKPKQFDFRKLLRPKQALFVYISPVNESQHRFVSIFYHQMFKVLFEMGEAQPDGRLPYPVHVICDDFATGCPIPNFDKTISIFREKGISATMLIQSETQLTNLYGRAAAQTIINNCDTIAYLGGMDLETCSSVAKRANMPLEDVISLPIGWEIFFHRGRKPILTKRYDLLKDPVYQEEIEGER